MSKFGMDFSTLLGQIDSVNTKKSYADDNAGFWKPTKDKAGNAAAIIRFLPNKDINDFPFVRMYSHSFKDATTGRWYIENSLTTIGGQDYISEVNRELWNTGLEENKKITSLRKRKLQYIVNILVIKDTGAPDNNGKVFKYRFGPKIWQKIVDAIKPDENLGEEPIMAFDVINGADFVLKMTKVDEQFNYDASKFNAKKPLFDGDEDKIEEVLKQCYDLNLEIAPEKFKSEEDLKKKFLWVIGESTSDSKPNKPAVSKAKQAQFDADDDELAELEKIASAEKPQKTVRKAPPMPPMDSGDDDDDAAFFKSLVND